MQRSGSACEYSSDSRAWLSHIFFRSNATAVSMAHRCAARGCRPGSRSGRRRPRSAAPNDGPRRPRCRHDRGCGQGSETSTMPGAMSSSSFAAANPRQASPVGSCSTTSRSFAHCCRPYLTRSARVGDGERRDRFGRGDVKLRVRKVRRAADMVAVQVGQDDVADVLAAVPQSVELVGRRLACLKDRPGEEPDRAHPSFRVGAVVDAVAGVDEDQTVVGLHHQHMTDALRTANGVHGAAVEMVDLHCSPTRASTSPRPICVTRLAESK